MPMTEAEYQRVIDELDRVLTETRELMERFEATGMDEKLPQDYDKLHAIYSQAVKDQHSYTLAMLDASEPSLPMPPDSP